MPIEYSKGYNAQIFCDTKTPTAETILNRVEQTPDSRWYERLFIRHKIAHNLFPNNFIDVVAVANKLATPPEPISRTRYQTTLFSRLAPVPAEHAIFSAHYAEITKASFDNYYNPKNAPKCICLICQEHFLFHKTHKLAKRADIVDQGIFDHFGIHVPTTDPTDYCLTPRGILFFEIEILHTPKLKRFIADVAPNPQKQYLEWLINKYEASRQLSLTSPNGGFNFS
jgi:hypothetical protein